MLIIVALVATPLSLLGSRVVRADSSVTISAVTGTFYPNPSNSASFDPSQLSSPAFMQQFPVVDFNPGTGAQTFCSNSTGITQSTRPFTNVVPNPDGTCGTQVVQGNGQQAGVGSLAQFEASFVGNFTVNAAGTVTFGTVSDDGWTLGFGAVGGGSAKPSYSSGALVNPPSATPVKGYAVVGAVNQSPIVSGNPVVVYFPVAGTYPLELDYTECCGGPLALTFAVSPATNRQGSDLWGSGDNSGSAAAPPCFQGDPINCNTGNLVESASDLRVAGRGRTLTLTRTYNGLDAANASAPHRFGWGWADSYALNLTFDTTVPPQAVVHTEDGSTIRFLAPSGGGYAPVGPWVIAKLTSNPGGTYTYTLPDQTFDVFSAAGGLLSESDRDGNTTALTYDNAGKLTTATDPAGRTLKFTVGSNGLVSAATDPLGRVVQYGYDTAANLTSVTDPAGNVTRYGYDAAHRLVGMTRPNGGVTTNVFDAAGRVTTQTDPLGRITALAYAGGTTTITDPKGNVTDETYRNDLLSNLTKGRGTPQAATSSYGYDDAGHRTTAIDPAGQPTEATYDGAGNLLTRTDGLGHTTRYTYSTANDVTSVTDPMGHVTTITRDAVGHPLSVAKTHSEDGRIATTAYRYDDAAHPGDLTASTDPDGNTTNFVHDAAGNLVRSSDPLGNATTYGYNVLGWRLAQTSPLGNATGGNAAQHTTTMTYDAAGDVLTTTDAAGGRMMSVYDADHNRIEQTDANRHSTRYGYDLADQQTEVDRPDGSTMKTSYDGDGKAATQTDGLNHVTAYTYDPLERPTTTSDPLARTTSYLYDRKGNRTAITDPLGRQTTMRYDAANRLTMITYSDGTTPGVSYTYDGDGRRLTMGDGTGTSQYSYDSLGRLIQTISGGNSMLTYSYDLAGHLTSLVYPTLTANNGGTVTRGYDTAGRMTSVSDWLGHTTSFGYDADGNMVAEAYPNGVSTTSSYDNADRQSGSTSSGAAGTILDLPYTRDSAGQLASDNATGTSPAVMQTFGYDTVNRLAGAAIPAGSTSVPNHAYTYDAADHLTSISDGVLSATLGYDRADELTASTNTVIGTTSYTSDANGNRQARTDAQGNLTSYRYDQANRLLSYTGPALNAVNAGVQTGAQSSGTTTGTTIQLDYSYDGDGLRRGKQPLGVTNLPSYSWDLAEGLPLLLQDTLTHYVTDPSGLPLEQIQSNGTVLYYHHDQLGSTRALTDSHGLPVATYVYDPYGNAVGTPPALVNPFQYAGQYKDVESGLYYLRARYYDPATAQFISRDPLAAATRSPYGYTGGNPLNATDPSGLYDYTYDWQIGSVGSTHGAAATIQYLEHHARSIFPFDTGGCDSIQPTKGYHCDLSLGPFNGPVDVSASSCTSFTFSTDAGHTAGAGGTIEFSTYDKDGYTYLRQTAHAPNAGFWENVFVPLGALALWSRQAGNLANAVAPQEQQQFEREFNQSLFFFGL